MHAELLSSLESALANGTLSPRDATFAESLVSQAKNPRGLSVSQWTWVGKLAARATASKKELTVENMGRVYTMLKTAGAKLRYPKIHLHAGGKVLKLYVSTARSRVPNVVNVVDEGSELWYGRIYEDGRWEPGHASEAEMKSVAKTLVGFAKAPEEVAAASGHLSGSCCFCNRELTDDRSTAVGYGKTCASHYGLQWG